MAWGDLAGNQMVSYTDAQGGGFTLKPGQSSVNSPQCMTKNDAFTKYNLATTSNTNTVASNQLMRKDYWVAGQFSATMTVGNSSVYYGYYDGLMGSITSNDISSIAGSGALINGIYYHTQTGDLIFNISNGSSTVSPNGWTTLSIRGTVYNRSSFINAGYISYYGYWQWTLATSNAIGTTVGATRAIVLT